MWIISKKMLRKFWEKHSGTKSALEEWHHAAATADWDSPARAKLAFGSRVDFVESDKGSKLAVFDVGGNKCRLITSIHYNTKVLYILAALTHREYDKNHWKRKF